MQASFRFARFVWAALTGIEPCLDDIFEIDDALQLTLTSIKETVDEAVWAASHHYAFEIRNAQGVLVELIPGGSHVPVTFEKRMEFVERAQRFRLKEFANSLEALKRGFHVFFSSSVAATFAPWEMELIVCGPNDCPVEEMKRVCVVDSAQDGERLWNILGQMTPQERKMFLKFGTGRGGLPPPGIEWQSKLQIFFKTSDRPDWQKQLPTAETCFSKIFIWRYDSDEVYLKKLRAAMALSIGIEDHAPEWAGLRAFTS
jgi:hypothetical protein